MSNFTVAATAVTMTSPEIGIPVINAAIVYITREGMSHGR